jgi:serine/threonine-protein kinase
MAPEQLAGEPTDARVDLYAAGIVLWELLTGERFAPASSREPPAPSALAHGIGEELDLVVERALRTRPDDRFANAREMRLALERAQPRAAMTTVSDWLQRIARGTLAERAKAAARIERRPAVRVMSESATAPASANDKDEATEVAPPERTPERRAPSGRVRRVVITATLAACVAGFLLIGIGWRRQRHVSERPAPPVVSAPPVESASAPAEPEPPPSAPAATLHGPAPSARDHVVRRAPGARPKAPVPAEGRDHRGACDPPYYWDETGRKRYRPECM